MRELYELKEKIISELKEYAKKPEMSASALETVDKLAHAAKNIDKLLESGEYSGHYEPMPYGPGYYSRARGRGADARRDSMGRYSSGGRYSYGDEYSMDHADMIEEVRGLMHQADDPKTRQEFERFISKLEQARP